MGAGHAAGVGVDDATASWEKSVSVQAGVGKVRPDVPVGLGRGEGGDGEGVLQLHSLVECGQFTDSQAAAEGRLAGRQHGER